jgi:hypothetical protein
MHLKTNIVFPDRDLNLIWPWFDPELIQSVNQASVYFTSLRLAIFDWTTKKDVVTERKETVINVTGVAKITLVT